MRSILTLALLPALLAGCSSPENSNATGGTGGGAGMGAGATGGAGGSGGGSGGTGGSGTGGTSGGGMCVMDTIVADQANNYSFTSDIKLTPVKVKPSNPDLTFDWSALTTDFLGHTTNPTADIDSVLLVILSVSVAQLEQHINADDGMLQTFGQGPLQLLTMNATTSAKLRTFGVVSVPENTYDTSNDVKLGVDDYLDPTKTDYTTHTLMLMPSKGTTAGAGARMIQPIVVDAASTTDKVTLTASTKLAPGADGHTGGTTGPSMAVSYDVELEKLTPVNVPAGSTNLKLDWSKMTKNGLGRDWIPRSISKVSIGHYTQTLKELEDGFLDLETLPTNLYSKYAPSDDPIDFSNMKDPQGNTFTGIDGSGTWILAVFCDAHYCGNPAPWFLTILKPCN